MGLFRKIFGGLKKTADAIGSGISSIFSKDFDDEFYDELTDILILADIGVSGSEQIIDGLKDAVKKEKIKTENDLKLRLALIIADIMGGGNGVGAKSVNAYGCGENTPDTPARNTNNTPNPDTPVRNTNNTPDPDTPARNTNNTPDRNATPDGPAVYMIIGVNGVGKTTSVGKLGRYFKSNGKSVLFVAGDTFRAAATEQLSEWADRVGVRIVKQGAGADPASVVFDGLTSVNAKGENIVLIDTAGRLHNKANLMEELKKIDRVVERVSPDADYKKLLVIDATTGGNALSQVEYFNNAVGIDGIILTKLDGTAKGGIVVAIRQEYNLPVLFVGVGEKPDDLIPFDAGEFANALVGVV